MWFMGDLFVGVFGCKNVDRTLLTYCSIWLFCICTLGNGVTISAESDAFVGRFVGDNRLYLLGMWFL